VTALLGILIAIALFGVIVLAAAIRILREYERAVVFRLGRLLGARGPGLVLLIPVIDRMVRVSLRTVTLRIPPQDVITRDNVPATVNAVAYFRVIDPGRAIVEVEDYMAATSQIAQTTLRSVLGKADLDILLSERERLNEDLQRIVDEQTEPWGVKVTTVEIKDVEIPGNMQRAMARQAEAERERRAKIINAEGEYQAAERLYQAATIISRDPAALQLRYLQTLLELGAGQTSTIVFPLPIDIVRPLTDALSRSTGGNGNPPHAPLPPGNGGGSSGGGEPEGGPSEIPPGAAGHEGGPIGYRPGASPYSPGPGMDEPPPAEGRPSPEG
jgi:regulator of protease activity HflC (stomatin/prohibitin superfamily)